jgi:xanthine dehydrogenase accessory factor
MKLRDLARQCIAQGETVARVTLSRVRGSAPREEGATMLVTRDGMAGSIGGGTLEWRALAQAQRGLSSGPSRSVTRHALGPDLGQCCGGHVELLTEIFDVTNFALWQEETLVKTRTLCLFGAGHVGKALVLVLAQTDLAVIWIDPRNNAFPSVVPANVSKMQLETPPDAFSRAPAGSLAMVMSHSHALDLEIVDAALRCPRIAAVGLIGSTSKRARFERRLAEMGHKPEVVAQLICPIGIGGIRSKKPGAIAISTAVQLLALDEQLKSGAISETTDTRQQAMSA